MRLNTTGKPLLLIAAVIVAVVVANTLAVLLNPGYSLIIGTRPDNGLITGFHGAEQDSAGTSYRWTSGTAEVVLSGPVPRGPTLLTLSLSWLPPGTASPRMLSVFLDDAYAISLAHADQPRSYTILLPTDTLNDGELRVGLHSETTVIPPDERELGIRLDKIGLSWSNATFPLPAPAPLLAQIGITLVWLVSARRMGLSTIITVLVVALIVAGLALMVALTPALAAIWQTRLFVASLICAGIVFAASALLPRIDPEASAWFVRGVLLITLVSLAIRLLGILHPSFFSHDLYIHSRRLADVARGNLTLIDTPWEFNRRITVVPPTIYMLMAPFTLIADRDNALQVFYSVVDGLTPLLVALLARRFSLSERASLAAAAMMAWLPMQFTALYWGFANQVVGQVLTLLALIIVLGPAPKAKRSWLAIVMLLAVIFLTHSGVLLLIGVALGLFIVFGFARALYTRPARSGPMLTWALHSNQMVYWRGWFGALLGAALIALTLQYVESLRLMAHGLVAGVGAGSDSAAQATDEGALLAQIWVGLKASFAPLPLLLVAAGLIALIWRSHGRERMLALTTTFSAIAFLAVDIITNIQIRYGYFIAPVACIGVAALIEPILRSRLGRTTAWALVGLVMVAGLGLWVTAALYGVKPSVNPLTH